MAIRLIPEKTKIINLAIRLNELLHEKNMQKKELYSTHNNKNNITRWCNEKQPVNPDKITNIDGLKEIADLLDVDVDYLLCRQVEKRKSPSNQQFSSWNQKINSNFKEELVLFDIMDSLKPTLKLLGYEYDYVSNSGIETIDEFQELQRKDESNFYLVTLEDTFMNSTGYEVHVMKDGKCVAILNEHEFKNLVKSLKAHILCDLEIIESIDK